MKMNSFIRYSPILTAVIFLIFLSACRRDCSGQDVKIGEIEHSEATLALVHYTDGQVINFINKEGTTNTFIVTEEQGLDSRLCVEVTCRPAFEFEGENACNYLSTDASNLILMSDRHFLHFNTGFALFSPESELIYEYIEIGVSGELSSDSAGLITAQNFTGSSLSASNTILENDLIWQDTSTMGIWRNLYAYANADLNLYLLFDPEKGIVEYKYEGEIWQLKE